MQRHKLFDITKEFTQDVKTYVSKNYGSNFKDARTKCVTQNGDPEAVKLETNDNMHKIYCNFQPNEFYPKVILLVMFINLSLTRIGVIL